MRGDVDELPPSVRHLVVLEHRSPSPVQVEVAPSACHGDLIKYLVKRFQDHTEGNDMVPVRLLLYATTDLADRKRGLRWDIDPEPRPVDRSYNIGRVLCFTHWSEPGLNVLHAGIH